MTNSDHFLAQMGSSEPRGYASNSEARKRLAAHPLAGYFIAEDGFGDLAIWRGDKDDAYPLTAIYRFQFGGDDILWDALIAAIEAAS